MSILKIPDTDIIALDFYIELDKTTQKKIKNTFKNYSSGSPLKDLALKLVEDVKLSSQRADEILTLVINLLVSKLAHEKEDGDFKNNLSESFRDLEDLEYAPEKYDEAAQDLLSIVTTDLMITVNGYRALTNETRVFRKANSSLTVKPIFIKDKNYGGVIVHHIKIEYDENDSTNEIIFSLDEEDLKNLKEEISKAEKRSKDLLAQAQLKVIQIQ